LAAEQVAAHHGSLAKEARLDSRDEAARGQAKVLVATASLELGIDIGHVDLVCQISSPHASATLLRAVGPLGPQRCAACPRRLFPLTRDDLIECAAMLRGVQDGELDRIAIPDAPLDVLAPADSSPRPRARKRGGGRAVFLSSAKLCLIKVSSHPISRTWWRCSRAATPRATGRRGALIHYDSVERQLRARKGSRMKRHPHGAYQFHRR